MDKQEVTHQHILDRLITVEEKVDKIDANTARMIAAFKAAEGAFTVLEFLAKLVKPILFIGAAAAAAAAIWHDVRK